jgi:O-antigen ligase
MRFEREDGYFLGAYALNLIVAEVLGLGIALFLIFGTAMREMDLIWQEALAIILAIAFPVLFFPYSRGGWMALDLTVHPPTVTPESEYRRINDVRDRNQES